jgi:hypothetical protein
VSWSTIRPGPTAESSSRGVSARRSRVALRGRTNASMFGPPSRGVYRLRRAPLLQRGDRAGEPGSARARPRRSGPTCARGAVASATATSATAPASWSGPGDRARARRRRLLARPIRFLEREPRPSARASVAHGVRVGITRGAELPLRFYLGDNRFVSRG